MAKETLSELSKRLLWKYVAKAGKDIHGNTPKYAKRVKGVNKAANRLHDVKFEEVATNATGPAVVGTGDTGDTWKKINNRMSKRLMAIYKGK